MSDGQQQPPRQPAASGATTYTPSFKDQARSVVQPLAVAEEEHVPIASARLVVPEEEQDNPQQTGSDSEGKPATASQSLNQNRRSKTLNGDDLSRTDATSTGVGNSKSSLTTSSTGGGAISKRTKYYIALGVLFVIIAAVVGLAVALTGGGGESSEDPTTPFFEQVGDNLDGSADFAFLGTALALSQTGHRMAAASATAVQVYEFVAEQWQQIGEDIVVSDITGTAGERFNLQDPALMAVAMDENGQHIIVGYGEGGFAEQGIVHVYKYIEPFNSWNLTGTPLNGTAAGDRFGTSVAMNADGDVIAVGAPGQEGAMGSINVYQRDADGEWRKRGGTILGDNTTTVVSELGRSVAISATGDRVAAGARSVPDGSSSQVPVATAVYEYNLLGDLQWTAMGESINEGSLTTITGWYVDLSDAGDIMVVSNAYLQEEDFVNINPDDLVVKAYQWINGGWVELGKKIHAGIIGDKAGYVVSLSGDGLAIGMGDSGTSTGGRSRGHAHIYKFVDNDWEQVGPDIEGQSDGDNFGFSVALSGDGTRFATGAPYSRAGGRDTGRVQVRALQL